MISFSFFGWFRDTELEKDGNIAWRRGAPDIHAFFGWMQIEEILPVHGRDAAILDARPWLAGHPHLNRPNDAANHIYVAANRLDIPGLKGLPGAGTFHQITPGRTLTVPGQRRRSLWSLPGFFHPSAGATLSYHEDPARWLVPGPDLSLRKLGGRRPAAGRQVLLQSAARGQEFVLTARPSNTRSWLTNVVFPDVV